MCVRRNLSLALWLKATTAVSWVSFVAVLAHWLTDDELGKVLFHFAAVALLAGLASAGWVQSALRIAPGCAAASSATALFRLNLSGTGRITVNSLGLTTCLWLLNDQDVLPLVASPLLVGTTGWVLALGAFYGATLRACGDLTTPLIILGPFRTLMPVLLLTLAPIARKPDDGLVLVLFLVATVLGSLTLSAFLIVRLQSFKSQAETKPTPEAHLSRWHWAGGVGWLLFQNLDILIVGITFSTIDAAVYLLARRVAGFAGQVIDGFRTVAAPRFALAYDLGEGALAALHRSRGYLLLVAGWVAGLIMVIIGPQLLTVMGNGASLSAPVFYWLLAGQLAPVFFGATGMTMAMTDMQRHRALLLVCVIIIAFPLLWNMGEDGPLALAQAIAFLQILNSLLAAITIYIRHALPPPALQIILAVGTPIQR